MHSEYRTVVRTRTFASRHALRPVWMGPDALWCCRSFAGSICQKLASTIQGLETPVDVKLKLIPIFQNMHHDAQTVAKVTTRYAGVYVPREWFPVFLWFSFGFCTTIKQTISCVVIPFDLAELGMRYQNVFCFRLIGRTRDIFRVCYLLDSAVSVCFWTDCNANGSNVHTFVPLTQV